MDLPIGFHRLDQDEYQDLRLPSASVFCCARSKTFLHARAQLDGKFEDKDSKAKRLGRAIHTLLFERDEFDKRFCVSQQCAATKRNGSRCVNTGKVVHEGLWYCGVKGHAPGEAEPPERDVLSDADAASAKAVDAKLWDSEVGKILKTQGRPEITVVGEIDGLKCKGRLDWLAMQPGQLTVVDAKKIQVGRGDEKTLQEHIRKYQYDVRMAVYRKLVHSVTGRWPRFLWLFLEDGFPHEVIPRMADRRMISVGGWKLDQVIAGWKHCEQSGEWPGYGSGIEPLGPEDWEAERYGVE